MNRIVKIIFQNTVTPVLNVVNWLIPKKKNRIVLYSNLGFRDNVEAMYRYLIKNGYNEKYEIVCASDKFYQVDDNQKNVIRVSIVAGLMYFMRSKYFFFCFGKYPVMPTKKQAVINLTHGMPIKKIGNAIPDNKGIRYDYFTKVITYSDFFCKYIKDSFGVQDNKVMISGAPRLDDYACPQRLKGLEKNENVVVWMPTYRESYEWENKFKLSLSEINDICSNENISLVIKPHPLDKFFGEQSISRENKCITIISDNTLYSQNVSLYGFLASTQGLLTDYSSVAIDYMLLDKPIGYLIDDSKEYESNRGFNFPLHEVLAGPIIKSEKDLINFLREVKNMNSDHANLRRSMTIKMFSEKNVKNNNRRILEAVGIRI